MHVVQWVPDHTLADRQLERRQGKRTNNRRVGRQPKKRGKPQDNRAQAAAREDKALKARKKKGPRGTNQDRKSREIH